jgi:hypothetical protein
LASLEEQPAVSLFLRMMNSPCLPARKEQARWQAAAVHWKAPLNPLGRRLDERECLLAMWGEVACRYAALNHLMGVRPGPGLRADWTNLRIDLESLATLHFIDAAIATEITRSSKRSARSKTLSL